MLKQNIMHRKCKTVKGFRQHPLGIMLVMPAVILMLGVIVYPLILNIIMSFQKILMMKPDLGKPFCGFENYIKVLQDKVFWSSALRSLVWTASSVSAQMILGMSVALLLNASIKFRGVFRGLMLIPWVTPGVVAAMTWRWMYDGQFGIISHVLVLLGILEKPIVWLANVNTALPAVILEHAWKSFPFVAIMLLAAMQTIPDDLYEAASLDGAGGWHKFWNVTLPSIRSTVAITMLLSAIWAFNSFDVIWLMTEGGPAGRTDTLTTYVYKATFMAFDLGKAAAIAVLMFIGMFFLVMLYLRSIRRNEL